ncbi:MAG: hypothetical protein WHS86_07575 [Desulfosoma sp.]
MSSSCRFHPEREAVVRCEKFEYGYCQECVDACQACTDPELYCRHRTACIIWELCRREVKRRRREACDQAARETEPTPPSL